VDCCESVIPAKSGKKTECRVKFSAIGDVRQCIADNVLFKKIFSQGKNQISIVDGLSILNNAIFLWLIL